jgi:succinyl-CoA synthetase alpha subunit
MGVMSTADAMPGGVGIAARSASLASEVAAGLSAAGLGQSAMVGIGGDPIHGIGFARCLELFRDDPATTHVVLLGELGGVEEEEAADFLAAEPYGKPVVALLVGRHAPKDRRMGHAGTVSVVGSGSIAQKAALLEATGVHIAQTPDDVARLLR